VCARRRRYPDVSEATDRRRRKRGQLVRYPTQQRQRAQLVGSAEAVLIAVVRAKTAKIVVGQREERDQIVVGDLARPSDEPDEFRIGQEPNRHETRYRRPSTPDMTTAAARKRTADRARCVGVGPDDQLIDLRAVAFCTAQPNQLCSTLSQWR